MEPTIGRIVHFHLDYNRLSDNGFYDQTVGQTLPMIITAVDPGRDGDLGNYPPTVSGQVFFNDNATAFRTHVQQGDELGQWQWPPGV